MEEKNERYLNVTLKNSQDDCDNEQVCISIVGILKNLKRFFALWVSVSIIVSILALVGSALMKKDEYKQMVSLISFTYDGVEKGLDPNGNKFNVNTVKSPQIIEAAFEELDIPIGKLEAVRKNIYFEGIIPQDTAERLTAYKNIFEESSGGSQLTAVDKIIEETYYPTQYKVYFDYSSTGLDAKEAAALLNQMLECYSEYFLEVYGYNGALGSSLSALDYQDYDYAEAVDLFDSTLSRLSTYVKQVSSTDTTRFRSTETGQTFADLTETISTIRNLDLERIASYVTLNTITKDKDSLLTYYQFKVESLQRNQVICQENLASINESIANYEKNTIMMFGANGSENMNVSASEASEQYDRLFNMKTDAQNELSTTIQSINLYNKRIERLTASTAINSATMKAKVEEDLSKLNSQVNILIDVVNRTADDYYKTVVFSKAYNILVPANASFGSVAKQAVSDSMMTIIILDALIFVIYFAAAVIVSCMQEYKKAHAAEGTDADKEETEEKPEKKVTKNEKTKNTK